MFVYDSRDLLPLSLSIRLLFALKTAENVQTTPQMVHATSTLCSIRNNTVRKNLPGQTLCHRPRTPWGFSSHLITHREPTVNVTSRTFSIEVCNGCERINELYEPLYNRTYCVVLPYKIGHRSKTRR